MVDSPAAAQRRHRRIGTGLFVAALAGAALFTDARGLFASGVAPTPASGFGPSAFAAIVPTAPGGAYLSPPLNGGSETPLPETGAPGGARPLFRQAVGGGQAWSGEPILPADPHLAVPLPQVDVPMLATPSPAAAALRAIDPNPGATHLPATTAAAAAVPEPASWLTMLTGFAALGVTLRRARLTPSAAGRR